jgi:hypothetical protein
MLTLVGAYQTTSRSRGPPPTLETLAASGSSSSQQGADKYEGLIERSLYARFREAMVTLIDYINTISPTFDGVNAVFGVLRVVQFIATCLCTGFQDL